jgi:hypothetical protein
VEHGIDVTNDLLILLADMLGACERVLARADRRDARLARIRRLGAEFERAVLDYWAELQADELREERQLHIDELLAKHC